MKRTRASKLAKALLSEKEMHEEGYHGRVSAWDKLRAEEKGKFNIFCERYRQSLRNKYIRERFGFIENSLRQGGKRGCKTFEEISGMDLFTAIEAEAGRKVRIGQRYYIKLDDDNMIVAVQLGQKPIEEGLNIAAAHVDSPVIVGRTIKLVQKYNMVYLLSAIEGGIEPGDYFNNGMSMFFHGVSSKNDEIIKFSIGEGEGEPRFYFMKNSAHFDDDRKTKISQLEALVGSMPFPEKKFDFKRRILLNVMEKLNRKVRTLLTEDDLNNGEIFFVPSGEANFVGIDSSMIGGYGQDNWANVFCLLRGFMHSSNPRYTKMAIFYSNEEIGDTGKGSLGSNLLTDVVLPALGGQVREGTAGQWRMQKNAWSMFMDVIEPIHGFDVEEHDVRDSPYFGSGMVIVPFSGESGRYGGYKSSPEFRHAFMKRLNERNVAYQFGTMGNQENLVGGNSASFHPSLAQGIDVGLPDAGQHRYNDLVSRIDLWNLFKAVLAFYSVEEHSKYMPK